MPSELKMTAASRPLAGFGAFVTGGSKGIGKAICIGLAEAGAAVALTGRGAADGPGTSNATAAEIVGAGGRALALNCDVRDAEQVQAAIDRAAETLGRLDLLVNNAGLFFPGHDVIHMELAQWNETIATHVTGMMLCARFAADHMIRGGGGSIVNMSSTAGDPQHDSTGNVVYSVAKAAVEQLTRGLARELAPNNVAVNAIRPMGLLTEGSLINADWLARYRGTSSGNMPHQGMSDAERMKRFADPSAIVPAIVHLALCRTGFSGNVVRRTDFNGAGFRDIAVPALA